MVNQRAGRERQGQVAVRGGRKFGDRWCPRIQKKNKYNSLMGIQQCVLENERLDTKAVEAEYK